MKAVEQIGFEAARLLMSVRLPHVCMIAFLYTTGGAHLYLGVSVFVYFGVCAPVRAAECRGVCSSRDVIFAWCSD